ncbi:phospho-sugar mutase [Alicyclobacillus dauci]|uniref:Phosphoglucomutase n=1 Tax=Alicyclobacillus dauci TaxID=1475485 RepID=A0ABY6Z5T0_9BACL|nr:phospho-sugar mutase [Alicyclobacillus dauci]WAH37671.1 phospho-sugar mutase [Alicyclobacillus dauci]
MTQHRNAIEVYRNWVAQTYLPSDLKAEIESIAGNEEEIESRFGLDLDFGTGGLRGVMGAGLNRMNIYTVRRATRALAEHVKTKGSEWVEKGVAIGYDCRHNSQLFAKIAGGTLAGAGVKAYVSPVLCPTPELSWAVRHLKAAAGIMITASHNPPEYNGFKAYNEHGGQILEDDALDIRTRMLAIENVFEIPSLTEEEAVASGLFISTPIDVRLSYLEEVVRRVRNDGIDDAGRRSVHVVYTPLHGTGLVPVEETLARAGYANVHVVPEQAQPDGDFSTVKSPNPEESEALEMGIAAAKVRGADLVMGTDPDADRVGIAVRTKDDDFRLLTGNQVGALLVDYFVTLRKNSGSNNAAMVFKTIVTSDFGADIAKRAGFAVEDTLTGFKYIGDRITAYEQTGEYELLVGYEESYGYLVSPIVRDKDAVQTCLAICEMVAYHKGQGKTLVDRLEELYAEFGYHAEKLLSVGLSGLDGVERMHRALDGLRRQPVSVPGLELEYVEDYLTGKRQFAQADGPEERLTLPKSDVQKFVFAGGHWAAVRPSGTEPKMKVYAAATGRDAEECENVLERIVQAVEARIRV